MVVVLSLVVDKATYNLSEESLGDGFNGQSDL